MNKNYEDKVKKKQLHVKITRRNGCNNLCRKRKFKDKIDWKVENLIRKFNIY